MENKSYYLAALTAVSLLVATSAFGCVDNLKPGEWCEVPNSMMKDQEAKPPLISQQLYDSIQGNAGVLGVMQKWSGGAFDTKRNRLVVWGGGHGGYGGNEIYAFDVNTLTWQRLTLPSAGPFDVDILGDGRPSSRHTYDSLDYLPPPIDKFFARGTYYYTFGGGSRTAWFFDFDTLQWQRRADLPEDSAVEIVGGYDPVGGLVYEQGYTRLWAYDPINNVWTEAGPSNGFYPISGTAAVDPKRRKLVRVGGGVAHMWDISQRPAPRTDLSTTGVKDIENAESPGFVYDPVSDRFVAWDGGASVYTLNMDTMTWTKVPPAATNTVTPPQITAEGGVYGRFQYIPSKNAFIAVNAADQNVYFYRLSAATGSPPPAKPATPNVQVR